jgi:hypothetical protein
MAEDPEHGDPAGSDALRYRVTSDTSDGAAVHEPGALQQNRPVADDRNPTEEEA